ncbi:hypothetical protein FRC09_010192 [Ceratobasidium sp. 395]|nr:hypothetical protein FRC09_010192 [Ceratobasidium sp. 395]
MTTKHDRSVVVARYPTYCNRRHPEAKLMWTSAQLAYAQHMELQRKSGPSTVSWAGLPVARSVASYVPFTDEEADLICAAAPNNIDFTPLVTLLGSIEASGPAHLQSTPQGPLNAHLPQDLYTGSVLALLQKQWPSVALFDEQNEDHATYAMATLSHWMKTSTCFRHQESGTLLCGPAGARWLIAVLAFLAQSLTRLDRRRDIPQPIVDSFNDYAQSQRWATVKLMVSRLHAELNNTLQILTATFPDRNQAWKHQLQAVYETGNDRPAHIDCPITQSSHFASINDLPQAASHTSSSSLPQPISNPSPVETAPVARPAAKRTVHVASPDMSAEYITLPDFSTDISHEDTIIHQARDADDDKDDRFSQLIEQSFGPQMLDPEHLPSDDEELTPVLTAHVLPEDPYAPTSNTLSPPKTVASGSGSNDLPRSQASYHLSACCLTAVPSTHTRAESQFNDPEAPDIQSKTITPDVETQSGKSQSSAELATQQPTSRHLATPHPATNNDLLLRTNALSVPGKDGEDPRQAVLDSNPPPAQGTSAEEKHPSFALEEVLFETHVLK